MERLWTRSFILMTLALFFLFFGFYTLLPTLPLFITEIGINESQVGLIIGLFTLAAVVTRPIIGGLVDRWGRRVFILVGLILFALSMYLYTWASGFVFLLLLRVFHGINWAISSTSLGTSITDIIPISRRGEGMGWYGMSMTISMAVGPLTGVWIVQNYSYSTLFLFGTVLTIAALLLSFITKIPFTRQRDKGKIQFFDKSILSICVVIFFLTIIYGGITTFLPLFAASLQVNGGTFFLVYALALTIIRPVAGKLADRHGAGFIIMPSMIIVIIALIVLSLSTGIAGIIASAILYGIGFGAAQPTLQAATLNLVPEHKRGVANASFFTAFDLGIGLGAILLGLVSQFFGYQVLFTVCAVSGVLSLLIFTMLVRKRLANVAYRS